MCATVIPERSPSSFVGFPGEISVLRAFLFALTSGPNSFEISNKEFLLGCSRFGIDVPFPFVVKRLALYGNDVNLEELIRD